MIRHAYTIRNPPQEQRIVATTYLSGTSIRFGGKMVPRAILPGKRIAIDRTGKAKKSKRQATRNENLRKGFCFQVSFHELVEDPLHAFLGDIQETLYIWS